MSRARDLADSADKDIVGTITVDGLTVAGNVSADGGTIKLDGNYPVGTNNVALGDTALDSVQSGGNYNVAIGGSAGTAITTGDWNTALGYLALSTEDTGSRATALGTFSLQTQNAGDVSTYNTAVGYAAGYSVTTGTENTLIGGFAGDAITTGGSNVALGTSALSANTTASYNTAIGANSLSADTLGSRSTALGFNALAVQNFTSATNAYNVAVGHNASVSMSTGTYNTALGSLALQSNTTANFNTTVGYQSGYSNTTGASNTVMGDRALYGNTTGGYNVAMGGEALRSNTTSSNNTAVGYQAGYSNTTGNENVYVGTQAGYSGTTAADNTIVGKSAGYSLTTGTYNTFVGRNSGDVITSGSKNTIIGKYNGNQGGLDIRTSSNNIVLSDGDGNPRMRIDSSGNVGIGTTSPTNGKLEVTHSSSTIPAGFFRNTSGSGDSPALTVQGGANNVAPNFSVLDYNGNTDFVVQGEGNVGIGTNSPDTKVQIKGAINSSQLILGGTDGRGLKISTTNEGGQNDGSVIFDAQDTESSGVNSNLIFSTGGTERCRIDGSGNLLVNTTSTSVVENGGFAVKPDVGNGTRLDISNAGEAMIVGRTGSNGQAILFYRGGTNVGSISLNSSTTAYNTSSDYRLKENVVDLTGASARVNQLDVKRFNFITDETNTLVDGFLAHEVATVVPEAITGTKDAMKDEEYEVTPAVLDDDGNVTTEAVMGTRSVPDYQGIDQSKLVPLLTAALQEALAKIDAMETRLTALEGA